MHIRRSKARPPEDPNVTVEEGSNSRTLDRRSRNNPARFRRERSLAVYMAALRFSDVNGVTWTEERTAFYYLALSKTVGTIRSRFDCIGMTIMHVL